MRFQKRHWIAHGQGGLCWRNGGVGLCQSYDCLDGPLPGMGARSNVGKQVGIEILLTEISPRHDLSRARAE